MFKILLIDLGDIRGELNEPLGIECISSRIIREGNVKVDICWYSMIESNLFDNLLQYDCIGISMNIGTLKRFEEIYNFLMKAKKNKFSLILGGCIPTFAYKQLLEKYDNIVCIYGEGEDAFYDVVNCFINEACSINDRLLQIGNLAFNLDNQIVITPKKPINLELGDTIVRDLHILEYIKMNHGIVRLEGSRGCSWNKCSFCCVNAKYADPNWRGFPIDKIIKELIEISNMGFRAPYFTDEDFFGQEYNRAIELGNRIIDMKSQGIIRKDLNFFISILAADAICESGKKALTVLKEAGLREVFLGIESLEKEQLKRYNKKASVDTNTKAINFINQIGLRIDSGYILFDPEMSFEALGINIKYIDSLKLNQFDSRSLKRLRIQPLTTICNTLSNVIIDDLDINNLEYPYKFIDRKVNEVYREYKAWEDENLEETWKIQSVSRGEISEEFRNKLKSILSQIRDIDFGVLNKIYMYVRDDITNIQNSDFIKIQKQRKEQLIKNAFNFISEFNLSGIK